MSGRMIAAPTTMGAAEEALAASLVSSAGFGVIDRGCGKMLIGSETQLKSFRFGNGTSESTSVLARIPMMMGKKNGLILAAVIKGKAPFCRWRGCRW